VILGFLEPLTCGLEEAFRFPTTASATIPAMFLMEAISYRPYMKSEESCIYLTPADDTLSSE
jgi:hypothetical protein